MAGEGKEKAGMEDSEHLPALSKVFSALLKLPLALYSNYPISHCEAIAVSVPRLHSELRLREQRTGPAEVLTLISMNSLQAGWPLAS